MKKYSRMATSSGMSGAEVAHKMLQDYGIHDVKIVEGTGFLTDHYHPVKKLISLSPGVYQGRNIAAAAVAAHECGHAVQHAKGYKWLEMRSKLVPAVQFGSNLYFWLIIGGLAIGLTGIAWLGVAMFAATTLFSFITLPVEYDASNRALAWLDTAGVTHGQEHAGAKDALKWAARTYVVAALASLGQLVYWVSVVLQD